jgi:very-short-patch-repair endonuclease
MTDAERILWARLRNGQLGGHKLRRQHPVGPYVADFCCEDRKVIVEVDGGQHADNSSDVVRTAWLERHGYRVVRVWNNEVLTNTDGVLAFILFVLEE